ncbi:hypothetical protein DRN84_01915 [Candidatus Geothermarchaeota archaeon]|nr:MAG: hypothetical protein DRN84_01915 [Candidatus Geothermarchaeota archaeon]HEW93777.1 polyprenyl synthetase family protein [Thermoprotei archaeon]
MLDESLITEIVSKLEVSEKYREFIVDKIKLIYNKIYRVLSDLRLESSKLYRAVTHLAYRGKLIRGLYSYLVSRALGADEQSSLTLSASAELYHMASLIHDDIIDKAEFRRGLESVHKKYGLEYAIIAGDTLIVYANYILSELGGGVIKILAEAGLKLADGEALEMDIDLPSNIDEYNKIVYLKTASFFEGLLKASAYIAGRIGLVDDLASLGKYIGFCFQYRDDVLDYIGESNILGKPTGLDRYKPNLLTILIHRYGYTLEDAIRVADEMIAKYIEKAVAILNKIDINQYDKEVLTDLTRLLRVRVA